MAKRTLKQQIEYHVRMATYNRKKAEESAARGEKFVTKAIMHETAARSIRIQIEEATS